MLPTSTNVVIDVQTKIPRDAQAGVAFVTRDKKFSGDMTMVLDTNSFKCAERMIKLDIVQGKLKEVDFDLLEGNDGVLSRIVFVAGEAIQRRAMFFSTGQRQASELPKKLGCELTEQGCVATGEYEATNVPGAYVAGDASRLVQFVIVAASEGAQAAVAINKELMKEECNER